MSPLFLKHDNLTVHQRINLRMNFYKYYHKSYFWDRNESKHARYLSKLFYYYSWLIGSNAL